MKSELIGKQFPVLSDGFVCLMDVMGTDEDIVQAAKTSYGKGTKSSSDERTLLRYLMRHRHTTPFEMAELKFMVRVPMDTWRQWVRHRTASINEYSTRYSEAIDEMDETGPSEWRLQSTANKQGSGGYLPSYFVDDEKTDGQSLSRQEKELHDYCRRVYKHRIDIGIAREQARKDLPLSTYTEAFWKIDLKNLLHFLGLRMESHAQLEIRQYATIIGEQIVKPLFPNTWEAFCDYHFNAISLSAPEQLIIQEALKRAVTDPTTGLRECLDVLAVIAMPDAKPGASNRERSEFMAKLDKLFV